MTSDTPGAKFIAYYNNAGASLEVSQDGVNWTHYLNGSEQSDFGTTDMTPYLLDFPVYIKEDSALQYEVDSSAMYAAIVNYDTSDPLEYTYSFGTIKFEGKLKYLLTPFSREQAESDSHCDPYVGYQINGYDPEQSIVIQSPFEYYFEVTYMEE